MAIITAKSLREKSDQELRDQLLLEKKRLFDGIVKSATGEAIKPHEKRLGRRLVARINAILSERKHRAELDAKIAKLSPVAEKAQAKVKRLIKTVEERAAAIKTELAKPAAERKVKPQLTRSRAKFFKGVELSGADRAGIALAEAKRKRAGLDREDMGQKK